MCNDTAKLTVQKTTMKAIQINDKQPSLIELPEPQGDDIKIKVCSVSICGSDLHLMANGWAETRVLGHEFAGFTPNGTAVAVEPIHSCGVCPACDEGYRSHCSGESNIIGVSVDGGMAEYVMAPAESLVVLPTGLSVHDACMVEPLAVALHGLNRAKVSPKDKVLVIGAGAIGLMTAAALQARGIAFDLLARHPQQQKAAYALGAHVCSLDTNPPIGDGYSIVFDAVGTAESLSQAAQRAKPMGKIAMLGSFWAPVALGMEFTMKELEIVAAMTYQCKSASREFVEAGNILAQNSHIVDTLISHRYPLDAASEAFISAADRAAGAIKVVFDL